VLFFFFFGRLVDFWWAFGGLYQPLNFTLNYIKHIYHDVSWEFKRARPGGAAGGGHPEPAEDLAEVEMGSWARWACDDRRGWFKKNHMDDIWHMMVLEKYWWMTLDDIGGYWYWMMMDDDGDDDVFGLSSSLPPMLAGEKLYKYCLMNLWTVNLPIFSNHFTYFTTIFHGCLDVYHHTARICGRFSAGMFRLQVSANTSTIGTSYWANGDPCHRGFCSNVWKTIYIITYYNPHPWKTYQRTQRTIKNNSGGGQVVQLNPV